MNFFKLLLLLPGLAAPAALAATVTVQVNGQDGRGLLEAVVYLESPAARAAVRPRADLEIEQVEKAFHPRVLVVAPGSAVNFPNRDRVRHHVYSLSSAKPFELKLYTGVPANPVVFDRSGVAVLGCNIHDNMVAWVVVAETPYTGVAGPDGRIQLNNVPPGSYRLRTWHPGLPPGAAALDQPLQVAGEQARVTVVLPLQGGGH
jgi:plastocyanin